MKKRFLTGVLALSLMLPGVPVTAAVSTTEIVLPKAAVQVTFAFNCCTLPVFVSVFVSVVASAAGFLTSATPANPDTASENAIPSANNVFVVLLITNSSISFRCPCTLFLLFS